MAKLISRINPEAYVIFSLVIPVSHKIAGDEIDSEILTLNPYIARAVTGLFDRMVNLWHTNAAFFNSNGNLRTDVFGPDGLLSPKGIKILSDTLHKAIKASPLRV